MYVINTEGALDCSSERVGALARGKDGHAVPQFCFADRGVIDRHIGATS
jgi:hypothetical protein